MNKKIILSKEYKNKHKENECFHIALVNLYNENFFESTVKKINLKKYGECSINYYSGEGTKPHFHIENKDLTFICCIRLDVPEYFQHGTKQGTLNNAQIKELIKILNSPAKTKRNTVFEALCDGWNNNLNNKFEVQYPYIIPDYTKLNK